MILQQIKPSFLLAGGLFLSTALTAQKPNIIVINIDDGGWGDPSCYGSTISLTPKIDFLAANGIKFNHCYAASSVSSPSRAALLTGCYPVRVGIPKVLSPAYANALEGIHPDEQLIPELLKPLGYATACVGKWHLGHAKVFLPPNHGFDEFFGIPYSNDMEPTNTYDATVWPNLPLHDRYSTVEFNPDQRYLTKRFTERSVDFITRNADADQPFFLYLAHAMPHTPLFVSDSFQNQSPNGIYSDVMSEIDWSVGEVLRVLQEKGITNNTLIIYTSDNGPWAAFGNHAGSAGPMSHGKNTTFDGGHRVPCVMYWPGTIPTGQVSNELITNMDFLPTICNITGASLPVKTIDGKNIISLMNGTPGAVSPTSTFYYYNDINLQAARTGDLKMHFSHLYQSVSVVGNNGVRGSYQNLTQPESLFNIVTDPAESNNIKAANSATYTNMKNAATAFDVLLKANDRAPGNSSTLPVPLDESPIHWTLDNVLTEASANGINLTGIGTYAFSTDAKFGSHALSLVAGQAGGLQLTPSGGNTYFNKAFSTKSVSLWIKTTDTSGDQVIFEEGGITHGISLKMSNNNLTVGMVANSGTMVTSQVPFTKLNQWVHLALVFNNGNVKVYENSVLKIDLNSAFTSIAAHMGDACLGTKTVDDVFGAVAIPGTPTHNFAGLLDEVKIFDRALILDEVVGLYTLNTVNTPDPNAVSPVQVTITDTNGSAATSYNSLTAAGGAFEAINAANQTGKTITIALSSSTVGENGTNALNAGLWTSLTMYPTANGVVISASVAGPLIDLNGADNVTINGAVGNTGSTKSMIITNSNTSASAAVSTIRFINDATNNTVKNCYLSGSGTLQSAAAVAGTGVLFFSTTTGTTGNDNNTITANNITNAGGNRPANGIYSFGTAAKANSGLTISNNTMHDIFNAILASRYIYMDDYTSNCSITGNRMYQANALTVSGSNGYRCILLEGKDDTTPNQNFNISNNVFGGNTATNTGTWTKTAGTNGFAVIYLASTTGTNTIDGNSIQNFDWSNAGNASFNGINFETGNTSNAVIGGVSGNTIRNIALRNTSSSGAFYGIFCQSAGNVEIRNTTITDINTYNAAGNATHIYGIQKTNVAGAFTANSNSITNCTANSTSTGNAQNLIGIYSLGSGTLAVSGNTMSGLTNATTNATVGTRGLVHGINLNNTTPTSVAISNNSIANLTIANANNSTATDASAIGILARVASATVSANSITALSNTNSAFMGRIIGLYTDLSNNSTTNTLSRNFLADFSVHASSTASVCGIYQANGLCTYSNNIIGLIGNSATTMYGIYDLGASGNTFKLYYNTIHLSGTPSATAPSYAFYGNAASNTRDFRNNIFVNARTTNGPHYGAYLNYVNTTNLILNNNNYYTPYTGGVQGYFNGANATTLPLIPIDANSSFGDPGITAGTTPESFKGTDALFADANVPGVPNDYAGNIRSSSPLMGAYESAVWNGSAWIGTPSATMSAVINGNFTSGGFSCLDLTVNPAKQVTLTSPTTIAGNLTLKSDSTNGTATLIDNTSLTVGANKSFVEQYLTIGRNWYLSSPVSAATSNVFAASSTNPLYYYVETSPNTWSSITNTSTALDAKKGYIASVNSSRAISFTGGALNTGTQTIDNLTRAGQSFTGYNLVGNPYPSYVSWAGATLTNVGSTIWYRSKNTNAYLFQTYNRAGQGSSVNGGTNLIPPMQAFWVKVETGTTGSIVFDNTDRTHNDQTVAANRLKTATEEARKIVRLEVSNGVNADETLIYTDANASNGFDTYDSNKMFTNSGGAPEIYTVLGNERVAINGFNAFTDNQQMALGFKTSATDISSYSLKATEIKNMAAGTKISLIDHANGNVEFDLTSGVAYTFTSGATNSSARFTLRFGVPNTTALTPTFNVRVYVNAANQLTILSSEKANYAIYNVVGMLQARGAVNSTLETRNTKLAQGIYVVRVIATGEGKEYTTRVMIR